MTTSTTTSTTARRYSPLARIALVAGFLLSALTIAAALIDRATSDAIGAHIARTYPDYSPAQVDQAASAWVVVLATIGGLGMICWAISWWGARRGALWVRWASPVLAALGLTIALVELTIRDGSGETGLAIVHGVLGLLPALAGILAVIGLWRARRPVD